MPELKEITDYHPNSYYPLLHRLYKAGYSIQGLRSILSTSGRRMADVTCKDLLTVQTDLISVRQVFIIAGLLGCTIQDVLEIILQRKDWQYIKTAQTLDGKIRTPEGYVNARKHHKSITPDNIPAPGWLDEIK